MTRKVCTAPLVGSQDGEPGRWRPLENDMGLPLQGVGNLQSPLPDCRPQSSLIICFWHLLISRTHQYNDCNDNYKWISLLWCRTHFFGTKIGKYKRLWKSGTLFITLRCFVTHRSEIKGLVRNVICFHILRWQEFVYGYLLLYFSYSCCILNLTKRSEFDGDNLPSRTSPAENPFYDYCIRLIS